MSFEKQIDVFKSSDTVHVSWLPTNWLVRRYGINPNQHPPTNKHVYTKTHVVAISSAVCL